MYMMIPFLLLLWTSCDAFLLSSSLSTPRYHRLKALKGAVTPQESFNVQLNEFFKKPVPRPILEKLSVYREKTPQTEFDTLSLLTASPASPGVPRPLWLVILGSVPTGLLWYGYYKFCVEEELLESEVAKGKVPRGFGGFGTLGPFVYLCLAGPIFTILHLPGGMNWTSLGIVFIYYTQFLLYDRVNEMYREMGEEEPLTLWWCLPIFFPFDLIVGLRQVHYLSNYYYRQRGVDPPKDPVVEFFPFIGAPNFRWQDFLLTPSMWCKLFGDVKPIQRKSLPAPIRDFLQFTEGDKK